MSARTPAMIAPRPHHPAGRRPNRETTGKLLTPLRNPAMLDLLGLGAALARGIREGA